MTRVLAFDVNETLLDLTALDRPFEELFGSAASRAQWFSQMLQLSFIGGITGSYVDFTAAQRAALHMIAQREGSWLNREQVDATVALMNSLPPHPEVPAALARLAATPLHMVALTNSVQDVAEEQLRNAGIRHVFHRVMSADALRRLKPAPEPYLAVATAFNVHPGDVRLIATHSWDVTGALQAGCKAAFLQRPGAVLSPIGPRPDIVAGNLEELADLVIARDVR
ncbi:MULTISPECIES: haloacid dehalogenase type II [Streptomyces]|uniref:Haloacid dehalogenase type II n=1 Tax=Streptomyces labedae TaxID=285569 RepID=A0ABP6R0M4_9ACTN|nr:haloacid dehalogenase type II [Streptomyces sp. TRM75561]MDH3036096.1 haloacid dehalogenase type II [Streptomyces sp. TRM75561]